MDWNNYYNVEPYNNGLIEIENSYIVNDDDLLLECPHCPPHAPRVKKGNFVTHLENQHKCNECGKFMPKKALISHQESVHMQCCKICNVTMLETPMKQHVLTHMKDCPHCNNPFFKNDLVNHIKNNHSLKAVMGMIQLDKIDEFNSLVADTPIFADKSGFIFKEV